MPSDDQIAFKEWGVVCRALELGRQTVILRKGGIHEGREGFRVQYDKFWLFPTGFHQGSNAIIPEAWPLCEQAEPATADRARITLYAVVQDAHQILDQQLLAHLKGRHIWTDQTIEQRFHYRSPGLFALVVRVYRRDVPVEVAVSPDMAGCKSWVELPDPISTTGLKPVMDDATFARNRAEIAAALEVILTSAP